MMKEKFVKALMVEPLKQPKVVYIPNKLKYLKQLVSREPHMTDSADILVLRDGVCILQNKDGALLDLQGNRKINNEIIAGIFFVLGVDDRGFIISFSNDKTEEYCNRFRAVEVYNDKEVLNSYWNNFETNINELEKLL